MPSAPALSIDIQVLLTSIDFKPIHIDDMMAETRLNTAALASLLLELALLQVVECIGGNDQRL